jgi:hypothetical protein
MIINQLLFDKYNMQWYETPLFIQKIILFLLQRDIKNFHIFGEMFVASMESAATVEQHLKNKIISIENIKNNVK